MRKISIDALPQTPWKNKGGVTREIAARYDGDRLVWRLSVADVDADGQFSIFHGASRVLTVFDGAGLRLAYDGGVIDARPGFPVRFSGDLPIDCSLVGGRVRDFNLIFDPAQAKADVERLEPGAHMLAARNGAFGLAPLRLPLAVNGSGVLSPGEFLFLEDPAPRIEISPDGAALLVLIR
jgi:hypothetical protein